MKVGIISIGDELLNGFTVDTNSSWISGQLFNYQELVVESKLVIGDTRNQIIDGLDNLITQNFNFIFISGGLGPTHDDITKLTLCEYFNCNTRLINHHYHNIKKKLENKENKVGDHIKEQCVILDISEPIMNLKGTALGMYIKYKKSKIFIMPGVPVEMKEMFLNEIAPCFLDPYFEKQKKHFTILTTGIYESKLSEILIFDIEKNQKEFKVAFLPSYIGVKIRILKNNHNVSNDKLIVFKEEIVQKIKKYVYGYNDDKIQNVVVEKIIEKNNTIAVAESCTGGLLSKMITDVPGSSRCFLGGVVAYNNLIKEEFLNVQSSLIKNKGAVSNEVVIQMAKGIMKKFKSDIGIAITGISGPSNLEKDKELGAVYIAIITRNKSIVKNFKLIPNRNIHRQVSAQTALNMLRLMLGK